MVRYDEEARHRGGREGRKETGGAAACAAQKEIAGMTLEIALSIIAGLLALIGTMMTLAITIGAGVLGWSLLQITSGNAERKAEKAIRECQYAEIQRMFDDVRRDTRLAKELVVHGTERNGTERNKERRFS